MNAIIRITSEITIQEGERICAEFLAAEKCEDILQIIFFISSGGGNTNIVSVLGELVKMSSKKIWSIGADFVGSTATKIFMMAPNRTLIPNTEVHIHEPAITLNGRYSATSLEEIVKREHNLAKVFFESLLSNSTLTYDVLMEKISGGRDWFLTEAEIKHYGIVTEEYNREVVKKLLVDD